MDNYVIVNGRKFRKGYTTGACAAAAAKAAALMLVTGKAVDFIEIDAPAGIRLNLPVTDVEFTNDRVKCSVVKDGGDDPDITTGLKIFAEVSLVKQKGISIKTGEGIGIVTLPGLKVEVGKPAINPVPMSMIIKEVNEAIPMESGVEVLLSVPGGDEVAGKTYNPKLGILGGISILGTTGIVNPMSEEAWKDSLELELKVMAAKGLNSAVFTFGNYGKNFANGEFGIDNENIIKISNFIGFMLDKAVENKFENILITGHLGKLVKVAAGIFQTHSRAADARMEILCSYAALEGASKNTVEQIYQCRTTEAAADIIVENGLQGVYDRIAANVSKRCSEYTFGKIKFGTVLFNGIDTLLALDDNAREILRKFGSTYGE